MKCLQKIITEKIERFNERNLFNRYFREDYLQYIKELEKEYNVEIDSISWKIKEV